jgi:hypothetical protein
MINFYLIKLNQIYLNFIISNQSKNRIIKLIIINNWNIILVVMLIKFKKDSINYKQINYFAIKGCRDLIQFWKWTKKMKRVEKI